ncbi:hypothetical protein DPMN_002190 [Dreissena polymorpha]|uniref:Uncharacterized protein n=1 Tax=Dreissena polymorpha TaxID=45954 RepID=A0A9D4MIN0_DREPO|nr:hypothetical protein DPMN_002190 [Dreissena polymorpha]
MIFILKRVQCTLANEALMCPVPCGDDVVWITQSASHTTYIQDTQHDHTPSSPGKFDQDTHIQHPHTHTAHMGDVCAQVPHVCSGSLGGVL